MYPEELFGTLFNDMTNVAEVAPDPTDIDAAVKGYEEASTTARLVWERRDDPKMPRRLRRVTTPSLVVGAEHDRLVPDEAADAYAAALPNSELVRIPGTGHALVIEQPAAVAKAVLDFQERAR
jgi:pimeloyl-ACP methyl ester carboxylesterase